MAYLIVGLGNIGKKYECTRHNLGFIIVNRIAETLAITWKEKSLGLIGSGQWENTKVYLLMPTTYMNESGRAVRHYLDFYQIPLDHLLVITDDIHLPFGRFRMRLKGSSGGHNGLKNIELHLGTDEYPRLRLGIGFEENTGKNLPDFVLASFDAEEKSCLPEITKEAVEIVHAFLQKPDKAIERASLFQLPQKK